MKEPKPVFLERRGYRRRRLMDAVRLLPFLGLGLWMVPLMWRLPGAASEAEATSIGDALIYIFGVWGMLVLVALLLWGKTREAVENTTDDGSA